MISEQAFTETPVFVPLFTIIIGLDPPNTAPTRIRPHLPKTVVFPRGARTGLFLSVLAGFPFRAPPLNLDPIAGFGPGSQQRLLMHLNADPVHFGNVIQISLRRNLAVPVSAIPQACCRI